ncbi:MAG TPA: SGNH hydrolase domain-containing protein [Micromonosporaceae bacterium]|jgi:hypothetical protein
MHERPIHRRHGWGLLAGGLAVGSVCALLVIQAISPSRHGTAQLVTATREATPTPTGQPSPSATPTPTPARTKAPDPYPGAAYLVEGGDLPDVPYRPRTSAAKHDRPVTYDNGCHQAQLAPAVITCAFGPKDAQRTIAVVGDSHSAEWLPALQSVADDLSWRIVSITKSGCRFEIYPADNVKHQSCRDWNAGVLNRLRTLRPDVVFTLATVGSSGSDSMHAGTVFSRWRALEEMGIPVVAIRDNPWYKFDLAECVATYGPRSSRCGGDRAQHGLTHPITVPHGYTLPANVHLLDLTNYYCERTFCPAVVGNVLVYRDDHHLTATFVKTAAPYLAAAIITAMGWQHPRPARTPV